MARQAQIGRVPGTRFYSPFPFSGMNLQSSSLAMDDKEFKWLENYVRLGDGNLRALWDAARPFYTTHSKTIVSFFHYTIGTTYYVAVFFSDGSAYQLATATGVATEIGGPGRFYVPGGSLPACAQWGVLYLLISNRNTQNDYWAWDGRLLYFAGTAAPNGVDLLATGEDYATVPTATAFGGHGSGMVLTPVINAGGVVNVEVTDAGHGYEVADVVQVAFSGGGSDTSAILTANVNSSGVTALNITANGSGYTHAAVGFTGGGGTGAAATAVIGTGVTAVTITDGGAHYTNATVAFSGGSGSGANGTVQLIGGQIVGVIINDPGSGYVTAPTVAFSGDGTGATGTAVIADGGIVSINVTDPGTGYTSAPTVAITGDGSGATAEAILSSGFVQSVTVTNPGSGFIYAPNILFVGGGGTGAAGTILLTGTSVARINLTSGGQNYTQVPTITFSGAGPNGDGGLAAHAILDGGSVTQVVLDNAGSGIESNVSIVFVNAKNDTTGNGAGAIAILSPTTIGSVQMSNYGIGYTDAPAVEVQAGANNSAYATVELMPFGISGDSMETFQSRVWIANPAPSPYDTIPPGGDFAVSAPGSITDYATSDGAVLFTNSDGFLQTRYTAIRQSSGYLYFFGDGSISIVSAVQTSGNPPTTTFSYQNVDPQAGLSWLASAKDFSKTIIFGNETGVYGLYGGVATKVSGKLDQLFTNAAFPPDTGALAPSAAIATLYNIKHYLMLMSVTDPDTLALRNVMVAWNEREWSIASQTPNLIYIGGQKVESVFTAWGTDGTSLYRLFQTPSSTLQKRLDSKVYGAPQLDMFKDLLYFYVTASDLSGAGVAMSVSFDAGGVSTQPPLASQQSVAGGLYPNILVDNAITVPAGTTPGQFQTWGSATGGLSFMLLGARLVSTSPDYVLASLMISYRETTPYQ